MHLSSTGTAIITRPRGQSAVLRQTLARHHVETLEFPLLEIAPAKDDAPLARALAMLEHYALAHLPHGNRPRQVPIGVVGPGSARALASLGIAQPDYRVIAPSVQDRAQGAQYTEAYGSEALADALDQRLGLASLARRRALILRADRGREWLAKVLDA